MTDIVERYIQPRNSRGRFASDQKAVDNPALDNEDRIRLCEHVFRKHAVIGAPDECWIWQGPMFKNGYGRLYLNRKTSVPASRAAMVLKHGHIDPKLEVCHKCDNRACVNPDHLFIGTTKDNAMDKAAKGRTHAMPGAANPNARLTEYDVKSIRLSGLRHAELAEKYSVSESLIRAIRKREVWKHV